MLPILSRDRRHGGRCGARSVVCEYKSERDNDQQDGIRHAPNACNCASNVKVMSNVQVRNDPCRLARQVKKIGKLENAVHASTSCTTWPATSVRRSLRPLWKY